MGKINFGVSADFYQHTNEDNISLVYIYKRTFRDGAINFNNYQLNTSATNLLLQNNLQRFRDQCGDRFLQSIDTGGGLYYSVKVIFRSASEKTRIKFKTSGSLLSFKAGGSFEKLITEEKINGSLIVRAIQSGGDVTQLSTIFQSSPNSSEGIVSCNFGQLKACQSVLESIDTYASVTFPAQLKDPNVVPNIIKYHLNDYAVTGAPSSLPYPTGLTTDFINDPVWIKRSELFIESTKLSTQIDAAHALERLYFTRIDQIPHSTVKNIRLQKLSLNKSTIDSLVELCWNYPVDCVNQVTYQKSNPQFYSSLNNMDNAWLEYPEVLPFGRWSIRSGFLTRTYMTRGNGEFCQIPYCGPLCFPTTISYPIITIDSTERNRILTKMNSLGQCPAPYVLPPGVNP